MKHHIKSLVSLTALAVALNQAPALFAQAGAGGGEEPVNPARPPRPPLAPRAARAASSSVGQLDQAEEQLEMAQAATVKAAVAAQESAWAVAGFSKSSSHSLVIPKDSADAKEIEDCEEDLNVMARILEKAGSRRAEKGPNAMGIVVHTSSFDQSSAPRNLYLDGYGAVFLLTVNYPLVAPPTRKENVEAKENAKGEWEETRRELYQPPGASPNYTYVFPPTGMGAGPAEEYDADRVDSLKQGLIAALKNAANIRKLKSDESVTVVVTGRGGSGGPEPKRVIRQTGGGVGGGGSYSSSSTTMRLAGVIPHNRDGRGSKMILRANKADIEAMQKGSLTAEEFAKKVTVQIY